jgi:MFS family permease
MRLKAGCAPERPPDLCPGHPSTCPGHPYTPLYYGWVLVGMLSLTVTVSYGVLMYAFPVLLAPMQAELGWSQAMLTGAFSLAALASGVAAIPIGRAVDRYGARAVMTTGSVGATVLLVGWSRAHQPLAYYAVWLGLGVCMATVFYEPAFAVATQWFHRRRMRAFAIITVAGGLASTIFVPLTVWLESVTGWRATVVWLAAVLGLLTILPHGVLLRRRPDASLHEDRASAAGSASSACASASVVRGLERPIAAADVFRSAEFRWMGAAFFLTAFASFAVAVHLIPVLLERGHTFRFAGASLAALGLAKLPGRLLAAPLSGRWSTSSATIVVFSAQAVGLVGFLIVPGATGVWLLILLFGAGDGAGTTMRADIVATLYGPREYGRISGVLAFYVAVARAAAPLGASLAYIAFGGYTPVLWILALIVMAGASAMARAEGSAEQGRSAIDASFPALLRLPVRDALTRHLSRRGRS